MRVEPEPLQYILDPPFNCAGALVRSFPEETSFGSCELMEEAPSRTQQLHSGIWKTYRGDRLDSPWKR
jgi:hypothetical protein